MANKLTLRFFQVKDTRLNADGFPTKVEYWVEDKSEGEERKGFAKDLLATVFQVLQDNLKDWIVLKHGQESTVAKKDKHWQLLVAILDNQVLRDPAIYEELLDENKKLRLVSSPVSRRLPSDFTPMAMLIIGVDNIMDVRGGAVLEGKKKTELSDLIRHRIDPRFRFFDSSIWHRYVPMVSIETFPDRLTHTVQSMAEYFEQGLYDTIVAQEYLEFQCRKLQQSYIKNQPGGHAKLVTPFRFHSESKMKELADTRLSKDIGPYTWGYLIVDDYETRKLRCGKEEQETISKNEWIKSLINRREGTGQAVIKGVSEHNAPGPDSPPSEGYITFGINRLRACRPDIIILDYFLGASGKPDEQYGHKFIARLREKEHREEVEKITEHNMIGGKLWIFPISGFADAFKSHLRILGENIGSRNLEIADGADPINSPELFRYLFYSFLHYQEQQVGLDLGELVDEIEKEINGKDGKKDKLNSLKPVLAKQFHRFTILNTRLNLLQEAAFSPTESEKNSTFAKSYLNLVDEYKIMGNLCLHIQSLVSLIAFGSLQDWPRMWEEYRLIQNLIANLKYDQDNKSKHLQEQVAKGQVILEKMNQYIRSIKNQVS